VDDPTNRPSRVQFLTASSSFASCIAAMRSAETLGTFTQANEASSTHQRIRASYVIVVPPSTTRTSPVT